MNMLKSIPRAVYGRAQRELRDTISATMRPAHLFLNVFLLWIVCGAPLPAAAQFVQPGTKLMDAPPYIFDPLAVGLSADGNMAFVSMTCYSGCDNGTVYTFTRTDGLWSAATAIPVAGLPHGGIGWALGVSDDGNALIVGAHLDLTRQGAGAAWVMTRSNGSWTLRATLPTGNATVAISGDGNTAIVGGVAQFIPFGPLDGGTWAYTLVGGIWTQQAKLTSGTGPAGLSRDGNTAIVGGEVYVRAAGVWAKQATLNGGASSVAISDSGDTAISGSAVYARTDGVWTQVAALAGGGASVAISRDGDTILLGTGETLRFANGAWTQLPGTLPSGSVALSGDGSTALVGASSSSSNPEAAWVFVQGGAGTVSAVPMLSGWQALCLAALLVAVGLFQLHRSLRRPT